MGLAEQYAIQVAGCGGFGVGCVWWWWCECVCVWGGGMGGGTGGGVPAGTGWGCWGGRQTSICHPGGRGGPGPRLEGQLVMAVPPAGWAEGRRSTGQVGEDPGRGPAPPPTLPTRGAWGWMMWCTPTPPHPTPSPAHADGHAPRGDHGAQHQPLPPAAADAGLQLRLGPRGLHHRPRLLQVGAVKWMYGYWPGRGVPTGRLGVPYLQSYRI